MVTFNLEFDDVATYAALVYRLQSITQHLDNAYGREGEIIYAERGDIETVLSDGAVGRWAIHTKSDVKGFD